MVKEKVLQFIGFLVDARVVDTDNPPMSAMKEVI